MNMPFPSRSQVEAIRKNYPLGTRVMLSKGMISTVLKTKPWATVSTALPAGLPGRR